MLSALLLLAGTLHGQWQAVGKLDAFTKSADGVELRAGVSIIRISVLAPDLVRIRASKNGVFQPDRSAAVVKTGWGSAPFEVRESPPQSEQYYGLGEKAGP